jgi:hypothetical protein
MEHERPRRKAGKTVAHFMMSSPWRQGATLMKIANSMPSFDVLVSMT